MARVIALLALLLVAAAILWPRPGLQIVWSSGSAGWLINGTQQNLKDATLRGRVGHQWVGIGANTMPEVVKAFDLPAGMQHSVLSIEAPCWSLEEVQVVLPTGEALPASTRFEDGYFPPKESIFRGQ
jgi:hypothetical protein